MYIHTKDDRIQLVRKNGKIFAPVKIREFTILLYLPGIENSQIKRGDSNSSNNKIFLESIKRLEFLVDYAVNEKIDTLNHLPQKINGVDYLESERNAAMVIKSKLIARGKNDN